MKDKVREFLDNVEKMVLEGMEKAEKGFNAVKNEVKEQADKIEDKFERERKIKAIKEGNKRRGAFVQAKRRKNK